MNHGILIPCFFFIALLVVSGCSSPASSVTSSPPSSLSPVSPARPVSDDRNAVQTFSRDGVSFTVSIDSITSQTRPASYDNFGWVLINYTFTNTATNPVSIKAMNGGIITDYPHKNKQCSDARTCNTTSLFISFRQKTEGGDILYPGVPRKVYSLNHFDRSDYETLEQGMTVSFEQFCAGSPSATGERCYEGWDEGLPSWRVDFAKDVTVIPAE